MSPASPASRSRIGAYVLALVSVLLCVLVLKWIDFDALGRQRSWRKAKGLLRDHAAMFPDVELDDTSIKGISMRGYVESRTDFEKLDSWLRQHGVHASLLAVTVVTNPVSQEALRDRPSIEIQGCLESER
jgi:hypothetical protein